MKRYSVPLLCVAGLIAVSCEKSLDVPDVDSVLNAVEIISPSRVRSGDYLPVVVRVLNESGATDWNASLDVELTAGPGDPMRIKKGMGSRTFRVDGVGDFEIGLRESRKKRAVSFVDDIQNRELSGTLAESDNLWERGIEYHITGDLIVPPGMDLTIGPGVRVLLGEGVNILVQGAIHALADFRDPILFTSRAWEESWGGVEILGEESEFQYCFFVNGGTDGSRQFGHSESQPVVYAADSRVTLAHCFFMDNPGKALGSLEGNVRISSSLITRCDTGGEFHKSLLQASGNHIIDIPNSDGVEVDDDNDGFYVLGVSDSWSSPCTIEACCFITGKDDAIDHNYSNLEISGCWLEDFDHEGLAGSNGHGVRIFNCVVKNCQQGVEAGYGSPDVRVDHCVLVDNEVGIRFGDIYTRASTGHLTVTNTILYGNEDNILNFEPQLNSAVEGAVDISFSMTNDSTYDGCPGCITGVPLFDDDYFLLSASPGKGEAQDGTDMGLIVR